MGYHVRIDESSQILLNALTTEPSKVFGKLYSAYLLLLVTQHDKEQLDWIVANSPGLDSLTGRHLAFAVFAKSFPVKIRTDATPSLVQTLLAGVVHPKGPAEIPAELLRRPEQVVRLVENGQFGVVLDGDELTAMTYGSDLVARELGLLGKLPCLVVIDGVPAQSPLVVPLTKKLLPELFPRLRGAMARFYEVDGHTAVRRDAELVIDIQKRIAAERVRDATLRTRITQEQEKLVKLRARAAAPPTTPDPNFFRDLVASREVALVELEQDLAAFPRTHAEREASLNEELATLIASHRARATKTFSHCLASELRSAGFQDGLSVAKTQSMSFLSSIFKPETLLKLWALVH